MSKDKDKKFKDEDEKKSKKDKKKLKDKQGKSGKKGSKDSKKKKGSAKSKKSSSKLSTSNVIFELTPVQQDTAAGKKHTTSLGEDWQDTDELIESNDFDVDAETEAEIDAILENEIDAFSEAYEGAVAEAIEDKPQLAADLFQSAYSSTATNNEEIRLTCAQAILLPYAKTYGIKEAQSLDLGRGFAMGMMSDSTCGALIAAIMLAGLADAPLEASSSIFNEFQKRYGSTFCKDILEGPATCRDIIKHACLLYEKFALGTGELAED